MIKNFLGIHRCTELQHKDKDFQLVLSAQVYIKQSKCVIEALQFYICLIFMATKGSEQLLSFVGWLVGVSHFSFEQEICHCLANVVKASLHSCQRSYCQVIGCLHSTIVSVISPLTFVANWSQMRNGLLGRVDRAVK